MRRAQRGFNLISLMVGMTLSLISILAMLSLYKNMVGVSVTFIQESRQDGQIAAALLTARHELRNAGFWMPGEPSANLQLLVGAELDNGRLTSPSTPSLPASPATGNALIWIYKNDNTATASCAGLLVQNGQLLSLKAAASCTSISQWNSTTWTSTTLIETGQPSTFFTTVITPCWPFGKTATLSSTQRVKVTMTAQTSTIDVSSTSTPQAYVKSISEVCLPNLAPSA